jgi:hypothetical protein
MSSIVRNLQLALFEEDFAVSPGDRRFIDEWLVNGGNQTAAMQAARPDLKRNSAKVRAVRKLNAEDPGNAELMRYRDWKQAQLVLLSQLTEDELVEKARRIYLHGVGDLPMLKSLVSRSEGGTVTVDEVEVREPSLSAANTAVELLRKLGGFGKDAEATPGAVTIEMHYGDAPRVMTHG